MTDWFKENMTVAAILKILGIAVSLIGFAFILNAKVGNIEKKQQNHINDYKEYRQVTVPNTYMRKDVAEQVIIRLERIERKIDNMNSE